MREALLKTEASSETNASKTSATEPLLRRKEVAVLANVHVQTVKSWEFAGRLPSVKINSRVTRYRREDVAKLLGQAA